MKLKKGDNVQVIRGREKGKKGAIEKVFPKENKVLIAGLNIYKRHFKSRIQNKPSEIIDITKPLPLVNVALVCPNCKKLTRVAFKIVNEEKVRVCAKCDKKI